MLIHIINNSPNALQTAILSSRVMRGTTIIPLPRSYTISNKVWVIDSPVVLFIISLYPKGGIWISGRPCGTLPITLKGGGPFKQNEYPMNPQTITKIAFLAVPINQIQLLNAFWYGFGSELEDPIFNVLTICK